MAMNVAMKREISEEEYLKRELIFGVRHELINCEACSMIGASNNYDRISGNIYWILGNFLWNSPCKPFFSDIKIKGSGNFFSVSMLVCNDQTENDYFTETSNALVGALPKSIRRIDETFKRVACQLIPTLQEYLLIEQDFVDIELSRTNEEWPPKHYFHL